MKKQFLDDQLNLSLRKLELLQIERRYLSSCIYVHFVGPVDPLNQNKPAMFQVDDLIETTAK